jgi:mono/diheme cytochrome c family protein
VAGVISRSANNGRIARLPQSANIVLLIFKVLINECLTLPLLERLSLRKSKLKTEVLMRQTLAVVTIILVAGLAYAIWTALGQSVQNTPDTPVAGGEMADVAVPDTLTQNAQIGKRAFEANCASCHGTNAAGREGVAPPLVHKIYEPSHHADESFQRAVASGVRAHHWPFGDMRAVEGLTRGEVTLITTYIRELQRANGIN